MPSISWRESGERKHDVLDYKTASLLQIANEQAREPHNVVEKKEWHSYKGYIAYRNREYENLWGPIMDSNHSAVDGMPGMFNNLRSMEQEIDRFLRDKAIMDKRKQDNLNLHRPPPDEPSPVIEETIEAEPTILKPYWKVQND